MVLSAYYPEGFGGSYQCRTLIQALEGRYLFYVLTLSFCPGKHEAYKVVDHVPIFRIRFWKNQILNLLLSVPQMVWVFLRIAPKVQIVHCHGITLKNYLVILLAKLFRKKIIQKFSSFGFDDPSSLDSNLRYAIQKKILAQCDCFVGIAPAFSKSFSVSSLKEKKFFEIPDGINLKRFYPVFDTATKQRQRQKLGIPKSAKVILFVGFFSHEKGVEDLFFVWKEIEREKRFSSFLILIGSRDTSYVEISRELVTKIENTAKNEGLSSSILFRENVEAIEDYYQVSDLFVLPSYREGLPNALLEAMACGLPVIASSLKGVTDSIIEEGQSGLFFEAGNRSMLKEKILQVFGNPALAESLGEFARQTVEDRYDIRKIAEQHKALYQGLIECAE